MLTLKWVAPAQSWLLNGKQWLSKIDVANLLSSCGLSAASNPVVLTGSTISGHTVTVAPGGGQFTNPVTGKEVNFKNTGQKPVVRTFAWELQAMSDKLQTAILNSGIVHEEWNSGAAGAIAASPELADLAEESAEQPAEMANAQEEQPIHEGEEQPAEEAEAAK